jgi:hypothetical protein
VDYFPVWRSELMRWQEVIRLTGNHRYQVLNDLTGKWDYVPGVTGSLSKGKDAVENLKKWAAEQAEAEAIRRLQFWIKAGAEGDPSQLFEGVHEAYKKNQDDSKNKGTIMHTHFERECRIRMGENPPDVPITHNEQLVLDKFRRLADQVHLKPIAVEAKVYCRPEFGAKYAGTLDLICFSDLSPEVPEVWDYKGKYRYQDCHWEDDALQSSAYRWAAKTMVSIPGEPGGRIINYPRPGYDFDLAHVKINTPLIPTFAAFCSGLIIQRWRNDVFKKTQTRRAA